MRKSKHTATRGNADVPIHPGPAAVAFASVALALFTGCGAPADAVEDIDDESTAVAESELCERDPMPVIFDTDMDFDDASALAFLCQEHKQGRIDLRAVTVTNNGVGLPGSAIRHARCVLAACGLTDIPVADGSPVGVHPAPIELSGAIEITLEGAFVGCTESTAPADVSAAELIVDTIDASHDDVTILTTGPLSNLAEALELADDDGYNLARDIEAAYVMGGAVGVPGNLFGSAAVGFDNSQEFNIWADPPAAEAVFDQMGNWDVHMVPLDATNHVPITQAFVTALGADMTTPEAQLVHTIVTQPIPQIGISQGLFFWWDPLAAVSMTRNDDEIVEFEKKKIRVVQDGVQSGRTKVHNQGDKLRVGMSADSELFEEAFLDGLNGRAP
ncbi:MAG: nucleoside hydrolase [Polyangiaceae bacterium]|nr:nucleoside hydrolase [Polyangiaceae bacterium]